jgi:hypothetical protein
VEITTSRKTFQAGERLHFHGERGRLVGVEVAEDSDAATFVREVILEDELLADEPSARVRLRAVPLQGGRPILRYRAARNDGASRVTGGRVADAFTSS